MFVSREAMYLCLATANVDFLSQEYTLYYKVDMGIKKIVARWVYFRKMARLYRYAPFLLLSRSTVYRVDYVATINFANGTDPRRGEDQSIPRKSSKIFPRCDTEQMRRIEHVLRESNVKIFSMSDTFSSFCRYRGISISKNTRNFMNYPISDRIDLIP